MNKEYIQFECYTSSNKLMEWHDYYTKQRHKVIEISIIAVVFKNIIFGRKQINSYNK